MIHFWNQSSQPILVYIKLAGSIAHWYKLSWPVPTNVFIFMIWYDYSRTDSSSIVPFQIMQRGILVQENLHLLFFYLDTVQQLFI